MTAEVPSGPTSLIRLAWPGLASAVCLAALFLVGLGQFYVFVLLTYAFFALTCFSLVHVVVSLRAHVSVRHRLLGAGANLLCPLVVAGYLIMSAQYDQERLASAQCRELHDKTMLWKTIRRNPPDSLDEMVAPLRQGDENFLDSVPDDPWGHPYVLEVNGNEFRIRSFGPDGKKHTVDDIVYPPRADPDPAAPQ